MLVIYYDFVYRLQAFYYELLNLRKSFVNSFMAELRHEEQFETAQFPFAA